MKSYANASECLLCHTTGGINHTIQSTPDVERFAKALNERLRPLCESSGNMLGVLYADGAWIVTLSNMAAQSWDFVRTVDAYSPDASAIAHQWSTVPTRSMGGRDIRGIISTSVKHARTDVCFKVDEPLLHGPKRSTVAMVGGERCVCAAPKLISYLTQDAASSKLPPQHVSMIEIWCGASRSGWKHGELADSCSFCARILPTLACRSTR